MNDDPNTDRTSIRTYVPAYQKDEWVTHAEELGMSQSEFVRTMVQAGRRGVSIEGNTDPEPSEEPDDPNLNPGGNDLEDHVRNVLESEGVLSWEELLAAVTADLETRLEDALDHLQDDGTVRYRGREGGYVLIDE
ncbi:DUF5805 domain-containing protein [Halopenitus sp. H-Gu1]|uniref:DUF5805 domain-containing protein n=1 Tax=Halopenitus sp. H-Gu1 TaxID=3242697 RepID=UPI00359E706D